MEKSNTSAQIKYFNVAIIISIVHSKRVEYLSNSFYGKCKECILSYFIYLFVNYSVKISLVMCTKDMALDPLKAGELHFMDNYRNAYLKLPQSWWWYEGIGIFYKNKFLFKS